MNIKHVINNLTESLTYNVSASIDSFKGINILIPMICQGFNGRIMEHKQHRQRCNTKCLKLSLKGMLFVAVRNTMFLF